MDKSHRITVWLLSALQFKKTGSRHLQCKTAHKCLNVCVFVKVMVGNEVGHLPFPVVSRIVGIRERKAHIKNQGKLPTMNENFDSQA